MPSPEQTAATNWLVKQSSQVKERDGLHVDQDVASATSVEEWLQRRGVKYAPPTNIPMHMIDTKRSRGNQAREDPIVEDSVKRFTTAMKAGRSFPPIVVRPLGAGSNKLVIVDGNNRHEAALVAKREFIFGIVIDEKTDGDLIKLLEVEANTTHGATPALGWRLQQAFHLVACGHGDELAAEAAGITTQQLRNGRAARQAEERAQILRIHRFAELSSTSKQYLNGIKLEDVFHAAAKLTVEHMLKIEQVQSLCRAVKTGSSESDQLAIVAEQKKLLVAENAARKALSKRVNSPKNTLAAGIGIVMNTDSKQLVSNIRTTHDRDTIRQRLKEVEDKILEIQIAMEDLNNLDLED